MNAKIGFLLLIALAVGSPVSSSPESKSPIDKRCEQCMDKNPSTAGMVDCADKAFKEWDAELNKNYQKLRTKLKPAQQASLKAAQLQWVKYRDAEFKSIDALYSDLEGTMYVPMQSMSRVEIVKRRAVELENYVRLRNIDG